MLHLSFIFFKTKDADSRLTLSLILRFNLRLGGYTPYNLDFKIDELGHLPASW
jgi:hypothetical protein